MPHMITAGLAQRVPLPLEDPLQLFADDVAKTLETYGPLQMLVYPELHLQGTEHLPVEERSAALEAAAVSLDDPFVAALGAIAAEHQIWLCPGSIGERDADGGFRNTQLLFAPDGTLVASYRKMFPWRPFEPHQPGTEFVVAKVPGAGAVGLSICYDAWFPEHSRHLAWMGANAILNIVKTTSEDREQELVLARANAIVNQVYMLSVNCASPIGRGRSIAVDPEGMVLGEAGLGEDTLVVRIDPAAVQRVREHGTAGTNRVWSQFHPGDASIKLPLYNGELDPARWAPQQPKHRS
ncbi:hydrolase [Glutamicibacter halophytocola]|uniref:carbon-nitrogen hydrolase family protein n=1 Tax=Glutamicibacter TaxID=1742989 RepID=UPI0006D4BF47|nr:MULTISPECIES: carbon-nitrogen hydrolase family protein [Glutamicibacter]ALG30304.1 hydrolase [Glutamicibacter halophytocola]MBF6670511.1 carbon-nitrogen hydrolase family protein [Glutamicibacter sp. FBE19]